MGFMGEGEVSEKLGASDVKCEGVEKIEDVMEKNEAQNGVTELVEDKKNDGKVKAQKMDADEEEIKESNGTEEKEVEEENLAGGSKNGGGNEDVGEEEHKTTGVTGMEATKNEAMEDGPKEIPEEETEGKVEEEEKLGHNKEKKGLKKRPRTKSSAARKEKSLMSEAEEKKENNLNTPTEEKPKEPKTPNERKEPTSPTAPAIQRPIRERKSVERLVATIEKDTDKEFRIEKGRGTALKDIPNVACKLSRRKSEDTFKLLHTILFGRRGKAAEVKNNISRFSGFVWHDDEEKQMRKLKEKLDKCVKEKLVEVCDVLDISISKSTTRKEDIIAKLIDFLMDPHATTTELLAEKEQLGKEKKRKMVSKSNVSTSGNASSKGSAKSQKRTEAASKKGGEKKSMSECDDETEVKNEAHEEKTVNGVPERSESEMSDQGESEKESASEDGPDEDKGKQKQGSAKSPAKNGSGKKAKTKQVTISKKATPLPNKTPAKSPSGNSKSDNDTSAKKSSRKKNNEAVKERSSTLKKSASKETTGKKIVKGKGKSKEDKIKPSDEELRNSICEILKEVDINTATFNDILKQLAELFNVDLTPRKSSIKLMIQGELKKLAEEQEDEEDEGVQA
ncbi:DNA ligase 1-like isoform X1 [Olea europaea subsp. europaea]|uniref:DNA ligase 1-like isoform X1 n=1 Tax=Olea europaea subsp. europaea TaxID=158383 RepID=A0A8S0UQ68_OLEEU|nr:DNA ligase 1-like isoform X1 [Olea europaea subsp. europaea]